MSTGTLTVAKKKPQEPIDPIVPLFSIRGRKSWLDWVDRLGAFVRQPNRADLIDRALEHYAEHRGFKEKPPARL
jgi:hypothetical protein